MRCPEQLDLTYISFFDLKKDVRTKRPELIFRA